MTLDGVVQPLHVVDLLNDSDSSDAENVVLTPEEVKRITDLASNLGHVARAHKKWIDDGGKALSVKTLHKYVAHLKTHKAYFEPGKRGRMPLLIKVENSEWLKGLEFRRSKGKSITSTKALAIAVGVITHHRPKAAAALFGHLSTEWARDNMRRNGFTVRRATTDRTCSSKEIRDGGIAFFALLAVEASCSVLWNSSFTCLQHGRVFRCSGQRKRDVDLDPRHCCHQGRAYCPSYRPSRSNGRTSSSAWRRLLTTFHPLPC